MFRRSFQTIDSETDGRSPLALLLGGALLAVWLYWFCCVPVSLFETSTSARVEVANASYRVEAPVSGKVVSVANLVLGRAVSEGEVLLEFEATALRLELGEAEAKLSAAGPQLEAVARELAAERASLAAERRRDVSVLAEARGRRREAAASLKLARSEAERARLLHLEKLASEAEVVRGEAEAERREAAAETVEAEGQRLASEASESRNDRQVRIASLERAEATLRGEVAVQRAKVVALEHGIDLRKVRAPAAGVISAVGRARVGSVLKEGDDVVSLVAGDELRLVAEFSPAAVFGRVRAGQGAQVRFEGFPWGEYGMPSAAVARVARDARDGRARVELALDGATARRIPLQHGQPAEVSVEVERKTPWRLLQRVVGKALAPDEPGGRAP